MWTFPHFYAAFLSMPLVFVLLVWSGQALAASDSANVKLKGQAEITYQDTNDKLDKQAYSNISIVSVNWLVKLSLEFDNDIYAIPNQRVYLPHRLINTGNIAASYQFSVIDQVDSVNKLQDIRLHYDLNADGIISEDEPALSAEPCLKPVEGKVCYNIRSLKPNEMHELVVSGLVSSTAKVGDIYALGIAAEAKLSRRLSGSVVADLITGSFKGANDHIKVLSGTNLVINKSASPMCGRAVMAGESVTYRLVFSNVGTDMPLESDFIIDGIEYQDGVILADLIPANLTLYKTLEASAQPIVKPSNGMLVVQLASDLDSNRWLSYSAWDGKNADDFVIGKIGAYYPSASLGKGQSGELLFNVTASEVQTTTRVFNQARFLTGADDTFIFRSNTTCTTLGDMEIDTGSGGDPSSGDPSEEARIRFMRPVSEAEKQVSADTSLRANQIDFYDENALTNAALFYLDSYPNYDVNKYGVYLQLHSNASNLRKDTVETKVILLTSSTGDTLRIRLVETGKNTGIFRTLYPIRLSSQKKGLGRICPAEGGLTPDNKERVECVLQGEMHGHLSAEAADSSFGRVNSKALIDPQSVVFDAMNNNPVAGAVVTIRNADGSIATNPDTGEPYSPTTTDKSGLFQYVRLYPESANHSGQYYLDVVPPDSYTFPSQRPKSFYSLRSVTDYSYGKKGYQSAGNGIFTLTENDPIMLTDIPLDLSTTGLFLLDKTTTTPKVGLGDIVKYQIKMTNHTGMDLYSVNIQDRLPYGFRYIAYSARIDNIPISNPSGSERSILNFTTESNESGNIEIKIPTNGTRTLSYLTRITAASLDGDGINVAQASSKTATGFPVVSNVSRATVEISQESVLLDRGIIIGRVYLPASCQSDKEAKDLPVGGVQIWMENGSWAKTDGQGLYSLYGIEQGDHVLKVDATTLPKGVTLSASDNRSFSDGDSRWVSITSGELHRTNFTLACPEKGVDDLVKRIEERNSAFDQAWKIDELGKKTGNESTVGSDGDVSSGVVGSKGAGTTQKVNDMVLYSIQLAALDTEEAAKEKLKTLEKQISLPAFIYHDGDQYSIRTGAELTQEALNEYKKALGQVDGLKPEIVSSVVSKMPAVIASSAGENLGIEVMPDPEQAVKEITEAQGKEGAWLWPQGNISSDGRFIFVARKGLTPVLLVNDKPVSKDNMGIQIENKKEKAQLIAWYGVELKPGSNTLKVTAKDSFGNTRTLGEKVFIQPSQAVSVLLQPLDKIVSTENDESLLPIKILIKDAEGNPAKGIYFATLTASDGQWVQPDIQDKEEGHQIRISNGERLVHLRSSGKSGEVKLGIKVNQMESSTSVTQLATLRPLIAIGMVSISAGKMRFKSNGDAPTSEDFANLMNGFRTEARTAIFMKGKVWDDKVITFSFDSSKGKKDELFRDINPTDYYPVYGDASTRGYEAQSRSPLYVKLEKGRNSIMWGDYSIAPSENNTADLARVRRTLTGLNSVYDDGSTRVQVFGAEVEDGHIVELISGNGTAMNYRLKNMPIVKHSEIVEILVYDRENTGLVIESRRLTRFDDYMIDDVSGYLSFKNVIPSFDENNNPVYIQVSYDTKNGEGNSNLVAGIFATHKVNDKLTIGASFTRDENSKTGSDLMGLFGVYKPGEKTKLTLGMAEMKNNDPSKGSGQAIRFDAEHTWDDGSRSSITWGRAEAGFTHSGAGVSAGREELSAKHSRKLSADTKLDVEMLDSRSLTKNERKMTLGATVSSKYEDWTLKGGTRHIRQKNVGDNTTMNTIILGAERPIEIADRKGRINAEVEQDTGNASRQRFKLGGDIDINDKAKAYISYENISSESGVSALSESASKDSLSFGVKGKITDKIDAYTEYRLRGNLNDRETEAVSGVKASYEIRPGFSISPTAEVVRSLEGSADKDSVSVSVSVDDKRSPNARKSYRAEVRDTDSATYLGGNASYVGRINEEWAGIAREELRVDIPKDKEQTLDHTLTLGLARRSKDNDNDLLLMYKNKEKRGENAGDNQSTHIASLQQNLAITDDISFSHRIGGKVKTVQVDDQAFDSNAILLDGRIIWDVNDRWSLDARAGVLATDGFSEKRYSAGMGAYFTVKQNLRVGLDYNIEGFEDTDLDPQGYNVQGPSVKLQYKFDEKELQWLFE